MEDKVLIFGHVNPDTDSICSAIVKQILNSQQEDKEPCEAMRLGPINKETQYVLDYLGIPAPKLLEKVSAGQEVILVDHNEFHQSVEGINKAKILEVIDHHRIYNFATTKPIYYIAKPYGCTSTILYEEFKVKDIPVTRKTATLMASAIISDTLLLKSLTTTHHDIKALEKLAKIAEIDINKYGIEMLKAGTNIDGISEEDLLKMDSKEYDKDGIKCIIAQINTADIEDALQREEALKKVMEKKIQEKELDLYILTITDVLKGNSVLIVLGNRADIIEKSYNLVDNKVFVEGVVSRKKQLIPLIEENL